VGLAARTADADGHGKGRAVDASGVLQGLHEQQGMRRRLHQQDKELPSRRGARAMLGEDRA
jgi:hypothetical protein